MYADLKRFLVPTVKAVALGLFSLLHLAAWAGGQSVTLRHEVEVPSACEGDADSPFPVLLDVAGRDACIAVGQAAWRNQESVLVTVGSEQCGIKAGTAWVVPGHSNPANTKMLEKMEALREAYPASEVSRRREASKVIECLRTRVVVRAQAGATGKQEK